MKYMIGIETERKFLVKDDRFKAMAVESHRLVQGYICRESGRTVRVRIADDRAYLTIKGSGSEDGTSRLEWETEIPVGEAEQLMTLCQGGIIDKTRYTVPALTAAEGAGTVQSVGQVAGNAGFSSGQPSGQSVGLAGWSATVDACKADDRNTARVWEVDEFHGDNAGLVMAEIELGSADEPFAMPEWLGEEVTGDRRYYNSMLAGHPYSTWSL